MDAASLTVRTHSSTDTNVRPKCARVVDAAAADRPAIGRHATDATAEAIITADNNLIRTLGREDLELLLS